MKQIDRIGAEILEELSDENIHTRSNILQHEKAMLRRDEEPYIDFKCDRALSILVNLNYLKREKRGEYKITPAGLSVLDKNREALYNQIKKHKKISEKNSKLVYEIFKEANEMFLIENISSIKLDVAEECLCSSLSKCLEKVMEEKGIRGYYADANYNRNEYMYKTIINDKYEVIRIKCDLIVHSRGENKGLDNLLAIEMKKKNNPQDRNENKERLKIMTRNTYYGEVMYEELPRHICRYVLGIFYDIDKDKKEVKMEFYRNGDIEWKEKMKFDDCGKIIQNEIINKLEGLHREV